MTDSERSNSTAAQIAAAGRAFSHSIKVAIGPAELRRMAAEKYVRGEIELEEFERRIAEALELER